jgi:hypothetical protein
MDEVSKGRGGYFPANIKHYYTIHNKGSCSNKEHKTCTVCTQVKRLLSQAPLPFYQPNHFEDFLRMIQPAWRHIIMIRKEKKNCSL